MSVVLDTRRTKFCRVGVSPGRGQSTHIDFGSIAARPNDAKRAPSRHVTRRATGCCGCTPSRNPSRTTQSDLRRIARNRGRGGEDESNRPRSFVLSCLFLLMRVRRPDVAIDRGLLFVEVVVAVRDKFPRDYGDSASAAELSRPERRSIIRTHDGRARSAGRPARAN